MKNCKKKKNKSAHSHSSIYPYGHHINLLNVRENWFIQKMLLNSKQTRAVFDSIYVISVLNILINHGVMILMVIQLIAEAFVSIPISFLRLIRSGIKLARGVLIQSYSNQLKYIHANNIQNISRLWPFVNSCSWTQNTE